MVHELGARTRDIHTLGLLLSSSVSGLGLGLAGGLLFRHIYGSDATGSQYTRQL